MNASCPIEDVARHASRDGVTFLTWTKLPPWLFQIRLASAFQVEVHPQIYGGRIEHHRLSLAPTMVTYLTFTVWTLLVYNIIESRFYWMNFRTCQSFPHFVL
jgi:hypothetical protein